MKYQAELTITEEADKLYTCLLTEKQLHDRSSINILKEDDALKIIINAKDPVAFRAAMNGIAQLLIVYNEMKNVTRKNPAIAGN